MALLATWTVTWVDLDGVTQSVAGLHTDDINTPFPGSCVRPQLDAQGRAFCDVEIDFGQPVNGTIDEDNFGFNAGFVSFDILPQGDNQRWILRTELSSSGGSKGRFRYFLDANVVSAGGESNGVERVDIYYNTIDIDVVNPAFDIMIPRSGLSPLLIPPGLENNTEDNPLRGQNDLFSIDLGTPASGFDVSDVTCPGGIVVALTSLGGVEGAREVDLRIGFPDHPGSGSFTVIIPAGSMTLFDDTSIENPAFSMQFYYSLAIITPPPPPPPDPPEPNTDAVATLSIVETSANTGDLVPVNITFDQTVNNFTLSDLSITGGILSNFSGSGASYSAILEIPSSGSGSIIVRLAADSVDEGNNAASDSVTYAEPVIVDAVATLDITQSSAATGAEVPINITFDQAVNNFTLSDLSTDAGTLGNFSGSGDTYSATITMPSSGSGYITVRLAADSVDEGNNAAHDSISYLEPVDAVADLSITQSNADTGSLVIVNITFDRAVNNFTLSDLSATSGTLSNLIGGFGTYSATLAIPFAGTGTITVSLAADSVDEGNNASSDTITYAPPPLPPEPPEPPDPPDPPIVPVVTSGLTNWRVELEGVDISKNVTEVSELASALDIESPTEFNSPSLRIKISTKDFLGIEYPNTIKVFANSKVLFSGRVSTIDYNLKPHSIDVIAHDNSKVMRDQVIENFGISKRVRVTKVDDTDSGEYPFTNVLSPVSDKSLVNGRSDVSALTVVDHFLTEGNLDPTNINYDDSALRSEGESLDVNPDVTIKSPYRWKSIPYIVDKILEYYDITDFDVFRDSFNTEPHFSANGRVGYDLENNLDTNDPTAEGVETAIFWTGNVTDILVDDNKFYFLYSSRLGNPSIIEYTPSTDTYLEILRRDTHAEWWKFAKDGNTFYILGTTKSSVDVSNPVLGAYDPTEITPATFIERFDGTNLITYVSSSNAYKPVVGMYYQLGFPRDGANDNVRRGIQPDTRKKFVLDGTDLYYLYAGASTCGVAIVTDINTTEAFISMPRDSYFNHLGMDFAINNNNLFFGGVFQKESTSTRKIVRKSL